MTDGRKLALAGGLAGFWACGWILWQVIPEKDVPWILGASLYAILLALAVAGMWQGRAVAKNLGRALALGAFGFGCWMAHFAWTFWIFKEPSLADRVLAVLHPRVLLFLVLPAAWLVWSFRRKS
ncbi:MAG: hypothetical protein ACOY3K_02795 [Candidatus Omnitrophota bacterium]